MEANDVELVSNMITALKRHGSIGFIGTFVSHDDTRTDCLTISMVAPMYDNTLFKVVEHQLSDIVQKVFETEIVNRESVNFIDPDISKNQQDEK